MLPGGYFGFGRFFLERAQPLADISKRSFHAGVTPEYEWLRDASVDCTRVGKSAAGSPAAALEL